MEDAHVNMDILKQNLELAIDIYLDRVNLCPCGDGVIQLFKGADSSLQLQRDKLKFFLKGSKKKKEQLERTDLPSLRDCLEDKGTTHGAWLSTTVHLLSSLLFPK